MPKDFNTVLDECLTQIMRGEANLEACLARYPQYADRLRELLEAALLLREEAPVTPSHEAFARVEQRLMWALEERRFRDASRGKLGRVLGQTLGLVPRTLGKSARALLSVLTAPFRPRRLRWAATFATALALMLMGGGLIYASNTALPGQPLYPVKKATEQVRLAFTFSDSDKAKLHVALAERRLDEVLALAAKGNDEPLPKLSDVAQRHLREAERIAQSLGVNSRGALASRLEESASLQLAALQQAVEEAPAEVSPALAEAFTASGEEYGKALETALGGIPSAPVVSAQRGTLLVMAADPPPPGLEHVVVEVRGIEVHRAAGPDSGWVTVIDEPVSFDLLRIAQVRKVLGSQSVEPGTYTQIRFVVNRVTVVVNGERHVADIPSGKVSLVRPFKVEEGKTTVVVLDFDGARSVHVTGTGQFKLTPVVKVLVREPTGKPTDQKKQDKRPAGKQAQGQSAGRPGIEQGLANVEMEGVIGAVKDGSWVINGQEILVAGETEVKGEPEVGRIAKIKGTLQPDGSILAEEVEVEGMNDDGAGGQRGRNRLSTRLKD